MNNKNISDFYDLKWVMSFDYILNPWISAKMNSKNLMFIKTKNTSTYLQEIGKDRIQFKIQSQQDSGLQEKL